MIIYNADRVSVFIAGHRVQRNWECMFLTPSTNYDFHNRLWNISYLLKLNVKLLVVFLWIAHMIILRQEIILWIGVIKAFMSTCSVVSDSLLLYGLSPTRLLCPWASPGKNTACSPPGLPWPPPGDLPNPGIKPVSHVSPALQGDSLPLNYWVQPRAFIPNIQFQTVCCSSEWHSVNSAIPKPEIVGYLLTVALGAGHEPMTCLLNLAHGGCEPRWHAHPMIKLLNSEVQLVEVSECVHVLCTQDKPGIHDSSASAVSMTPWWCSPLSLWRWAAFAITGLNSRTYIQAAQTCSHESEGKFWWATASPERRRTAESPG